MKYYHKFHIPKEEKPKESEDTYNEIGDHIYLVINGSFNLKLSANDLTSVKQSRITNQNRPLTQRSCTSSKVFPLLKLP